MTDEDDDALEVDASEGTAALADPAFDKIAVRGCISSCGSKAHQLVTREFTPGVAAPIWWALIVGHQDFHGRWGIRTSTEGEW